MNPECLPEMTRRVFLNRTLQALGAAAVLPLTAMQPADAGEPGTARRVPRLRFLNPAEYATLEAVADTLIPGGGAFPLGARDVDLALRIDHYLPGLDPAVAVGFRGALAFIEAKAPALADETGAFSTLDDDARHAVLDAMLREAGLPRGVLVATKYFCVLHFYTSERTWSHTGYDGPMLLEETR
ncbi:MAG: gluconate 2-dehydrogenase subunit 3 family protein [Gammaproteobacteria bacterium]|jgi:hypothetical protein